MIDTTSQGFTRMLFKTLAIASLFALGTAGAASAACPTPNTTPLKSLSAGFAAWKDVTAAMTACGDFAAELDQEFATKLPEALAAKPALYQIAGVSADSIVPVLNAGTIRPLDDLVAKYGAGLSPNQLIKLNGKIYVIAMMVNAQTLVYRADILDKLGIAVPATYDELLAAAEKIKQAHAVEYPIGATMRTGWNLGEDFVNLYLGYGGAFFGAGNKATLNNPAGVNALEMMKKLTAYMDPEYLTADSTKVQQQFQQGKIALSNLWASRVGAMDDKAESKVVGLVKTAAAPRAIPGGKPATTLWWDGAAIATNITEEQAVAAIHLIEAGMSPATVAAHNDDAVWLIKGYQPGPIAAGAIASLQSGAPPYPVSTQMGLLHSAIGNNLADFFTGKLSAEATLAKVEAAYTTSAKEAGVLQ
jgi:ABC-type glycerol-3-phosphate transport system substrate-binding protein